jgi:hypothetical protein
MKRTIFSLAAVALLAVGCAENTTTEVNPVIKDDLNAIGFEMGTGKVTDTRAAGDNTLATLQANTTGIMVTAIKNSGTSYFLNKYYKYTGGAWGWVETAAADWKLWPAAGSTEYPLDFYANFPAVAMSHVEDATDELRGFFPIYDAVGSQIDYMAAKKEDVGVRPPSGKVTLNFKHITSKIDFAVAAGAGTTVEVQSIKVMNVNNNVGNNAYFDHFTFKWVSSSVVATDYSYMVAPAKAANIFDSTTAANVTGDNGSMMLMPQDISNYDWVWQNIPGDDPETGESYIEVVYRVTETTGGADVVGYGDASNHPDWDTSVTVHTPHDPAKHPADNTKLFIKVGYPLSTLWEVNTAYKYTLKLGDPSSTGGYLIDEYFIDEDGDTTDLKVVMPGTPGDPYPDVPDPIYSDSDEIGFDVDTSGWDNETAQDLEF